MAAPAASADTAAKPHDKLSCKVKASEHGDWLKIKITSDGWDKDKDRDKARVEVDFDKGHDVDDKVKLDKRGNAELHVKIPNRADKADVTVNIKDGRDRADCNDHVRHLSDKH